MRVLVTGSRTWTHVAAVHGELHHALLAASGRLTVVHGGCPNGADAIAARWARSRVAVAEEVHAADWTPDGRFDPRAGLRRSATMVDSKPDLVLAFIAECSQRSCRKPRPHGSHGASHCAGLAEAAGLRVRRWTQ